MAAILIADVLPSMLPRLWRFALRLSGDTHDAEDLLQRACVRALERPTQLQPDTEAITWMFSIVHSTWINEVRARSVRARYGMTWDDALLETVADPAAPTPESDLINRQIIASVNKLPETQRIVLLLVGVEGLSYGEAADVLNVPLGTIMSRLSRARQSLGAMLTERDAPNAMTRQRGDHIGFEKNTGTAMEGRTP